MDLDSIITFFILFLFFVLPSVLRQLQKKKKPSEQKSEPVKTRKGPFALLDKLGQGLRDFIEELEQQASQQRAKGDKEPSVWDELAEDSEDMSDNFRQKAAAEKRQYPGDWKDQAEYPFMDEQERACFEKPAADRGRRRKRKTGSMVVPGPALGKKSGTASPGLCFRKNHLQNAVIWSEILSKPVSLRND